MKVYEKVWRIDLMTNDSRLRKIGNKVLDAGAADLEEYAVNATHEVLRQVKDWLVNLYNSRISNTHNTTAVLKLEDLEKRIQLSNECLKQQMRHTAPQKIKKKKELPDFLKSGSSFSLRIMKTVAKSLPRRASSLEKPSNYGLFRASEIIPTRSLPAAWT